ncbi:MAG: hypothetical protein ABI186_00055 [Candidatus Elarobacter sp.]
MMKRLGGIALFAICALVSLGTGASAQSATAAPGATPAPTAAPTPVALTAHAHAEVRAVAHGSTYTGTARLALAQRGNLIRIDVLSVKSDAAALAPFQLTVVVDRGANTITAWSDTTRRYRVQPFLPRAVPSASPKPNATPRPGPAGTSPLATLDVFALSITLIGHTTTAGIPTTGLAFDLHVRKRGESAASRVTASLQLADEFPAFPMTVEASVEPGAAPFSARASYAVDDLARVAPAPERFAVPAGYSEAPSFAAVLFPHAAGRTASPSPRPRS